MQHLLPQADCSTSLFCVSPIRSHLPQKYYCVTWPIPCSQMTSRMAHWGAVLHTQRRWDSLQGCVERCFLFHRIHLVAGSINTCYCSSPQPAGKTHSSETALSSVNAELLPWQRVLPLSFLAVRWPLVIVPYYDTTMHAAICRQIRLKIHAISQL